MVDGLHGKGSFMVVPCIPLWMNATNDMITNVSSISVFADAGICVWLGWLG